MGHSKLQTGKRFTCDNATCSRSFCREIVGGGQKKEDCVYKRTYHKVANIFSLNEWSLLNFFKIKNRLYTTFFDFHNNILQPLE